MTWGSHCPQCGLPDCEWVAGPHCEGLARIKAFKEFAPSQPRVQWPWGTRWLARLISKQMVELEGINAYWCAVAKKDFDDIRLVDVKIKPDEFQMLLRSGVGGILVSWMLQAIRSIGAKAYVEVRGEHPEQGQLIFTIAQISGEAPGARAQRYEEIIRSYCTPRPVADWHEDMGSCLFWTLDERGYPSETPYCGTPNDIKPFHIIDGSVKIDDAGELKGNESVGGKIHTIDSHPFPVYATHFTRTPEASLEWKPPDAPPVNRMKV